jgi:thioredoxin reductase (NADPH)
VRGAAARGAQLADEFEVLVAGSGIAGLTAGLTAARLGRRTLVLAGDVPGGQLASIDNVEGFPGFADGVAGYWLCPTVQEQAAAAGAEFAMESVESLAPQRGQWLVTTAERAILARAVIVATGSTLKKLGVPGEERLSGRGVSQCASCDGSLFRDRIVAVVGGGDSAMQEALTLAAFAAKVIVLHRRGALRGQASFCQRVAAHPKIETRFNATVTEILGDDRVTGLRARDVGTGASFELEIAALFVYVGLQPKTAFAAELFSLDSAGRIPTDALMRTARTGICAAGNVRGGSPCRAASAAGDGANAAAAVDRYLADGSWRD